MAQKKHYLAPRCKTISQAMGSLICYSGQENESFSFYDSYGNEDFND